MMTDTFDFPLENVVPPVSFTYSYPGQSIFRRALIRSVEFLSGAPRLQFLYREWAACGKEPGESVFDAALRVMRVRPSIRGQEHISSIAPEGGLLIVANHPFGIVDGLMMGHLGMRLRGNVHIMTNSLLCRVPEVDPYLLPIDFSGTPEARRLTAETRRRAARLLAQGRTVAIFPAGSVATANSPLRGPAVDLQWHPFVGKLATIPGVTTVPVHFSGQNSRLFHLASYVSYPLRIALVFHETRRRMARPVDLTIGRPIPADDLCHLNRDAIARELRRRVMALAGPSLADPDEHYVWPSYIRW